MYFMEGMKEAALYSKKALEEMKRLGIAPNPTNYTLWYVYKTGSNPSLKDDIDTALPSVGKQAFNEDYGTEIFERYFGTQAESSALKEASRRIEAAVGQLQKFLGEAGQSAAKYSESLEDCTSRLLDGSAADVVRTVVQDILDSTARMAEQHKKLEHRIDESAKEITVLRRNMKNARRQSLTDPLTGIANRKSFDDRLAAAVERAKQEEFPLALLMIDIDHFKVFNDEHGHQIGDMVLKLVARTFNECVRGHDLPARYGGEEFTVILPGSQHEDALKIAERMRKTIENRKLISRSTGEPIGRITISVGVAAYQRGDAAVDLIARADAAMYAAKRAGRNQVASQEDAAKPVAAAG